MRRTSLFTALVGGLALAAPRAALADDLVVASPPAAVATQPKVAAQAATPRPAPAAPRQSEPGAGYRFYGWQNILVGELSLAAGVGLSIAEAPEASGLIGLVYLFGGPVVHAAHDDFGKVIGSVILNVTMPLMGVAIGAAADREGDTGILVGAFSGLIGAPLIDGLALGWQKKKHQDGSRTGGLDVPFVNVQRAANGDVTGATAGMVGSF